MGIIGKGRIVTEERVEYCGARVLWHVVLFVDEALNLEREVGRSMDAFHANAIKARWEKETCATFEPAPIKYSATGQRSVRVYKKPMGRDPKAAKRGAPESRMMKGKVSDGDSV